jgi:ATP-dependent Lon protease
LLDRTEIIAVSGYTFDEKIHIAQRHLLPKQVAAHGLGRGDVEIGEDALLKIAIGYTREAGVRNLEREIAGICRSKAVEYADAKEKDEMARYRPEVTVQDVERILGVNVSNSSYVAHQPFHG